MRAVDQVPACMRGGSLVCYFALAHLAPHRLLQQLLAEEAATPVVLFKN